MEDIEWKLTTVCANESHVALQWGNKGHTMLHILSCIHFIHHVSCAKEGAVHVMVAKFDT